MDQTEAEMEVGIYPLSSSDSSGMAFDNTVFWV